MIEARDWFGFLQRYNGQKVTFIFIDLDCCKKSQTKPPFWKMWEVKSASSLFEHVFGKKLKSSNLFIDFKRSKKFLTLKVSLSRLAYFSALFYCIFKCTFTEA
jgi:hypothetical protein